MAEVSKGKVYIYNSEEKCAYRNCVCVCVCDMFQPFALRATLSGHAEQHEHQSQVAKSSYDLSYLLGIGRRSPQRHATTVGEICSKVL